MEEREISLSAKNVTKAYRIFKTPGQRFLYHVFNTRSGSDFYALQNVNFDVYKGESFGIIGKNGSGKSTLLQLLAGILKPTSGELSVNGRVSALLELGSGFNPENTGVENIYMNSAILGVRKGEIENKIEEIIAFADIGNFIHQPVKTYSSGMYVRLAFAVAINVDADIILIDEALAVGDVFFRQKCYAKLDQLREEGKTIILVSHGMNEVEQFCDRVLLLNQGNAMFLGDSKEAVKLYYVLDQKQEDTELQDLEREEEIITNLKTTEKKDKVVIDGWERKDDIFFDLNSSEEFSDEKATFLRVGLFDEDGYSKRVFHQGDTACFYYEVFVKKNIQLPLAGIVIRDQKNIIIHGKDNLQINMKLPDMVASGTILYCLQYLKMDIAVGEYTFETGFATISRNGYEHRSACNQEEVNAQMERLCVRPNVGTFAVHEKTMGDPMRLMFHGCADLPGTIKILVDEDGKK